MRGLDGNVITQRVDASDLALNSVSAIVRLLCRACWGRATQEYVYVDSMVTVVDASAFASNLDCGLTPSERGGQGQVAAEDDVRPLGELLADQVCLFGWLVVDC